MNKSIQNRLFLLFSFMCITFMSSVFAHTQKVVLKNKTDKTIVDYTLEVPEVKFSLPLGEYVAEVRGELVPVELSANVKGERVLILPVGKIAPKEEISIVIKSGSSELYPKRTYAELAHKIGGEFVGHKYEGGFSWVKINQVTLPGTFRDHSYYIKYEGPGWENDRVAFRFYLDNRNAIDVFGKKTSDLVLPFVGVDGFDNYHNMSFWGMDNMKVGKGLGIGTIAIWDGKNAVRVEKRDSTTCLIAADGKIRSQVKTIYHGWDANGVKCNLSSLITLDAGSRASRMELFVDKKIDNLATGIIKIANTNYIVSNDKKSEWSYIATFGKQSLNKDMQGLAIFFRTKQLKEVTEDALNYVVTLSPENGYVEYYFMPTWELDKEPVADEATFRKCIDEVLNRLNSDIQVTVKK